MKEADEILNDLYSVNPQLKKIAESTTLGEYFSEALAWRPSVRYFPYNDKFKRILLGYIKDYYGVAIAQTAADQLNRHFVVNTASHLSLPRTFDKPETQNEFQVTSMDYQSNILFAAMHRMMHDPFAITMSTGRVFPDNNISAKYLQMSDLVRVPRKDCTVGEVFKITTPEWKATPELFADPIDAKMIKEIEKWIENVRKSLRKKFAKMTPAEKSKLALEMQAVMTVTEIFKGNMGNYPKQIAKANSFLINKTLPQTIRQLTLETEVIEWRFLSVVLCDKSSLTYKIFSDDVLRQKFLDTFADIATGWKKGEPPVDVLQKDENGHIRVSSEKYEGSLTPEAIVFNMKANRIMPKNILQLWVNMVEGGMLQVGGMMQSNYSTEFRNRAVAFLQEINEPERAASVAKVPTHIAIMGPVWGIKEEDGSMISYQSALNGAEYDGKALDRIVNVSGRDALLAGSLGLYDLLMHSTGSSKKLTVAEKKNIIDMLCSQGSVLLERDILPHQERTINPMRMNQGNTGR